MILILTLVLLCFQGQAVVGQECVKTGQCRCSMSDNSGDINLNSLASTNGAPRWTLDGGDKFEYSYNPCIGYSSPLFEDLAIHQVRINETNLEYDLGVQSYEDFQTDTNSGTSVVYKSFDERRTSRVLLVCDLYAEHSLAFIGELITLEYDFILYGPCACPGVCDNQGIKPETTTTPPTTTTQTTTTTTSASTTTTTTKKPDQTGFNWNKVGADLVGLIFHDLILIFVIGTVYAVIKLFFVPQQPQKKPAEENAYANINFSANGSNVDAKSPDVTSGQNADQIKTAVTLG